MGKFLNLEHTRQAQVKQSSDFFSLNAKVDGIYKKLPYAFCLPKEYAAENLFEEIRQPAINYFSKHRIRWHDGSELNPSNHLCDSQVCAVNFLYPFADKPAALVALLKPLFPDIRQVLPMDGQYVAFEWIGAKNYLQERIRGQRTRGANFTSADAAVMIEHQDGTRHIILIEWKYTESYSPLSKKIAKSGTDRSEIYRHLYDHEDFPLDKSRFSYDALFYEPFYQFFRQQTLAHEMERANELDANRVSLLHLAPAHNLDFQRVTSPELVSLGGTVIDVWNPSFMIKVALTASV